MSDDLIRRTDAINSVLGITMYQGRVPTDTVIFQINNIPAVEPKQKWIPCSERLPEDLATVLVWTEGEDIGIAFHMLDDGESDFAKISPAEGKVIAWMPMPGPWEGASK